MRLIVAECSENVKHIDVCDAGWQIKYAATEEGKPGTVQ